MWTVNFQMFKLVLEKAEEPEIKSPTSAGSSNKNINLRACYMVDFVGVFVNEKGLIEWGTWVFKGMPGAFSFVSDTTPHSNIYTKYEEGDPF